MILAAPASLAAVARTPTSAALVNTRWCDARRSAAWVGLTSARYHTCMNLLFLLLQLGNFCRYFVGRHNFHVTIFMAAFRQCDRTGLTGEMIQELGALEES
jgi:hypothetical protein